MNFIDRLFHRPPISIPDRNPINGQYSASPRTRQMRSRAAQVRMQLEVGFAVLSPEQRREAIERAKCGGRG